MKKLFVILELALFTGWIVPFTGCKKDPEIPTLTTHVVSNITSASASSGGSVTSNGGAEVTVRGVCWGITHNPTIDFAKTTDGTSSGFFSSNIVGLEPNTIYHVRAYATNSVGTAYGNEISFTSQDLPPVPPGPDVITSAITYITSFSAVSGGSLLNIQSDFLPESGVCWSTSQNPTRDDSKTINETGELNFTSYLRGLTQGTTYYVRAYALIGNALDNDILYGNELSLTTSFQPVTGVTGTQKANFPGGTRYAGAGFSIGTKVYLGLGTSDGDNLLKDFWEWDQTTNIWTKKSDYPGNSNIGAVGFSIGAKGYIGAGFSNEFWEYDPTKDKWTEKSSLPGIYGIGYAVGFSIGTKGYIGTGQLHDGITNSYSYNLDFWEWDQETNVWIKKAYFPGNVRSGAVGFSIGNKGYIGTGHGQGTCADFWEWDQTTDVWTKKADFAGAPRYSAVGFSIGNKGYIGTGVFDFGNNNISFKDFWEWDQTTDIWSQKTNFAGNARSGDVGVSIGNSGYIGTGIGSDGNVGYVLQDFWEYNPKYH